MCIEIQNIFDITFVNSLVDITIVGQKSIQHLQFSEGKPQEKFSFTLYSY